MQKLSMRSLALGISLLFALTFVPVTVFAHGGRGSDDRRVSVATEETEGGTEDRGAGSLKKQLKELKEQRQQNQQHRLDANKLRVCEARKAKIASIITRSITRAEKQITLFDTIAERVEAFYEQKGRVLANYDELVAAVDTAKTDAEANLEALKDLESFDCSSEDPKGNIEAFKLAVKSINQDLKDYRTSVKDLIVGVKSVQSTTVKDEVDGGEE